MVRGTTQTLALLQGHVLTHFAWAGDLWLFAATLAELREMLQDAAETVRSTVDRVADAWAPPSR